jgi:hypothetical protein
MLPENKLPKKFTSTLMTIRKWHWMSSALCFVCMLLFSITGITLNHAADIEASPTTIHFKGVVPSDLLKPIAVVTDAKKSIEFTEPLLNWFEKNHHLRFANNHAEINDTELYLALPRPGGDAWLSVDTASGNFEYESTNRGWISYANDLHKGRNTGMAWVYFMDVFAIACIIFSVTGFLLLQRYADTRSQTWPLLIGGLLVPIFFMMFLIHS